MTKCIGYAFKQGSFEGVPYDNVLLFVVSNDDPDITGMSGSQIKIKRSDLPRIMGDLTPDKILDKEIELLYSISKDKPILRKISLSSDVLFG